MDKSTYAPKMNRVPEWVGQAVKIITAAGFILTVLVLFRAWQLGYLSDLDNLQVLIRGFSWGAPIVFLLLQIMQVVVPIVPGGITMAAGVMLFGPALGLVYNYVGVVIGSVAAFLLARNYGESLVRRAVSDRVYDKYIKKINSKSYERFFTISILAPLAPDDALCYLTGLTDMPVTQFVRIIVLCKPFTIVAFSLLTMEAGRFIIERL